MSRKLAGVEKRWWWRRDGGSGWWQLERESDDLFPRVFRRMATVSGEMEVSRALLGKRGAFWG